MATGRIRFSAVILFLASAVVLSAEPVAVHHVEGLVHGFLSLRSPEGRLLASGDLIQNMRGGRVSSRLVFHFKDGSLSDETAVFTEAREFQLVTDHLVQKGPAFPRALDMTIDRASGRVTARYMNEKGEEKVEDEKMDLPPDLANGMLITVLKNIRRDAMPQSFSLIVATPKPRLVKLKLSVTGADRFSIAGARKQATHYVLKVELGGLTGAIAPIVGKAPPDAHVWILEGEAPAFIRSQSQMFMNAPLWQIDQVGPAWP
jgi:hypothetical protein